MDLTNHDTTEPEEGQPAKVNLLVNKQDVINALQSLLDQYPGDEIPSNVLEETLEKFLGTRDLGRLTHNPAIEKLDQVLARHKIPRTS
jgi:hypothetical protein